MNDTIKYKIKEAIEEIKHNNEWIKRDTDSIRQLHVSIDNYCKKNEELILFVHQLENIGK